MNGIELNTRDAKIPTMRSQELADQIYDTLLGNTGLSIHHVGFDMSRLQQWEITHNVIHFEIEGKVYRIVVTQDDPDYFKVNDCTFQEE